MLGLGRTALDTILGMLGIVAHAGSKPAWALLRGAVGVVQHNLADHVQLNNLDKEIMAMKAAGISEVEHNGEKRWPLTCSFDMGWQKRAAGKQYNSPSGYAFLVGCFSNKLLWRICYTKGCATCHLKWKKQGVSVDDATAANELGELGRVKTDHRCPHNFKGSSKSMEARGALSMVIAMFNLGKNYISRLLTDDDSTTCSNMRHPFHELVKLGIMKPKTDKETDWPNTAKGHFVADKGKLPLMVKAIDDFLADPTHRAKSFG